MMKNIRIILICFHVLITTFLTYSLYHHVFNTANASDHEKQISRIIGYINELFRISLYHTASIIAIWYSRRYGAGMIRATGILLIGELLQVFTMVIQHALETHRLDTTELVFVVINVWVLSGAIIITFLMAKNISKYQKDLMQAEMLTTTMSEASMDGFGNFSLV